MPRITQIVIPKGYAQKIYWKDDDEKKADSKITTFTPPEDDFTVFNEGEAQWTPAALINPPASEACLKVSVGGLDDALINSGKKCHIELSCAEPSKFHLISRPTPLNTLTAGHGTDERIFQVSLKASSEGASSTNRPKVPVAFWQNFWWQLVVDDDGSRISMPPVVLELYILPNALPPYFAQVDPADGVPRLLCRMFVNTATRHGVQTTEEWVAHVVAICHGSREPEFTSDPKNTENHWLKYNAWTGDSSFVGVNATSAAYNYGGNFHLEAWLNAYRNFTSYGALTLINCYDQAAACEVALSIGMEYSSITWQYHQVFGYINRSAQLVGWGFCNNPYFGSGKTKKLMDDSDPKRSGFSNHAFLTWKEDFTLDTYNAVPNKDDYGWEGKGDPHLLAIDACAGPHYGNEPVGDYIKPEDVKDRAQDPSDYWSSRDPIPNQDKPNDCLYKDKGWGAPKDPHHALTQGITSLEGMNDSRAPYAFSPLFVLQIDWTQFEPAADSAQDLFTGQVPQVLNNFSGMLGPNWSDATRIPIADINRGDGSTTYEAKIYAPDQAPKLNFYSLQITSCPNAQAAVLALKARAQQVIMSSELKVSDGTKVLESDYSRLFVYKNLMLEISGLPLDGDLPLDTITQSVNDDIRKVG